jgi:hypothetical protein
VQTELKMMNNGYKEWPEKAKFIRTDKEPIDSSETTECVKPDNFSTFYLQFKAPKDAGEHILFFQLEANHK